jgi:hypothetical protein
VIFAEPPYFGLIGERIAQVGVEYEKDRNGINDVALRRFELFGVVDEEQRVVRDAFGFFAVLHLLQPVNQHDQIVVILLQIAVSCAMQMIRGELYSQGGGIVAQIEL